MKEWAVQGLNPVPIAARGSVVRAATIEVFPDPVFPNSQMIGAVAAALLRATSWDSPSASEVAFSTAFQKEEKPQSCRRAQMVSLCLIIGTLDEPGFRVSQRVVPGDDVRLDKRRRASPSHSPRRDQPR